MTSDVHDAVDARATRVAVAALCVGAVLLGVTLNAPNGSWQFYAAGFAMAATWITAFVVAHTTWRRDGHTVTDTIVGTAVGLVMFGVFAVGSWALHGIPVFANAIDGLLRTADSSTVGWVLALACSLLIRIAPPQYEMQPSPEEVVAIRAAGLRARLDAFVGRVLQDAA